MKVAVERSHPDVHNPATQVPVPNELRPLSNEDSTNSACYLPQLQDLISTSTKLHMGPVGPWVSEKGDLGSLSRLTDVRPVVDKYSIHRYTETDWKFHNQELLNTTQKEQRRANLLNWNGRQCLLTSFDYVDKTQKHNTEILNHRVLEIHRWKHQLEKVIAAASVEIKLLEEERHRLKEASKMLHLPESISAECLERRISRIDFELVRDEVEEEVIKEAALCAKIRDIFSSTLTDIEKQLSENKTAKQRLEYDWADKRVVLEIDSNSLALNNKSTTILFKPGSVYFPSDQSTPNFWEQFTSDTLLETEKTLQRSLNLRENVNAILVNVSRDLRTQADKIENALSKRIECGREVTKRLENELKIILRQIVEVEELKETLKSALRRIEVPMKVTQTRLDNRIFRPRVENCRDKVNFMLIAEAKSINEIVVAIRAELKQAENSEITLIQIRNALEREIMLKTKTLEIDIDRTRIIRSYFPSVTALSGY